MSNFLKTLKLADTLTTELAIQRSDFLRAFRASVQEGSSTPFSGFTDIFSSMKKEYVGKVCKDHFEVRKRRRLFDTGFNGAVRAKGTMRQQDNMLAIVVEIECFHRRIVPFIVLLSLFYFLVIAAVLFSEEIKGIHLLFYTIFISLHGVLMMLIPYFMLRRAVLDSNMIWSVSYFL